MLTSSTDLYRQVRQKFVLLGKAIDPVSKTHKMDFGDELQWHGIDHNKTLYLWVQVVIHTHYTTCRNYYMFTVWCKTHWGRWNSVSFRVNAKAKLYEPVLGSKLYIGVQHKRLWESPNKTVYNYKYSFGNKFGILKKTLALLAEAVPLLELSIGFSCIISTGLCERQAV